MVTGPFAGLGFAEVGRRLRAGLADPVDLVEASLQAIATSQPALNAFVTVSADEARRDAVAARDELARGLDRGPLHGIPVAVKDLIDTAGVRTTMGSRHFADHVPAQDAVVVTRLRAAGAVIVGKTTTHEFAFGPTGDRAANGPAANPHDPTRMAGGSSAGSAAAVGAGLVPVAVGTDTGGSVRIPAALCGAVGLRPSQGPAANAAAIPTGGVFELSWSLDTVGPIAADVAGAVALWRVLAASEAPVHPPELFGLALGVVADEWYDRLDDQVRARFAELIAVLEAAGARLTAVPAADAAQLRALYATVQLVEALSIHERRLRDAPELFDPEVRLRLEAAVDIPATDYARALRQVADLRATAGQRLAGCAAVLLPTVPVLAPPLGARDADIGGGWTSPRDALLAHCAPWSVLGLPAVSIPLPGPGLPIGAQLVGAPGGDADLLGLAAAVSAAVAVAVG